MNVVDSSGWLEYFANSTNANFFAPPIEDIENLVVPGISIYEVFKRILQQRGENSALQAVVAMQQGTVVELSVSLAINAGKISHTHKIPMADSIILATTQAHKATLWTQDIDFQNMPNVKFIAKS